MRILFAADVMPDPDSGAGGTEWQTIQALRRQGHEVDEIWAADLGRRIRHGNLHYLLELPGAYRRAIAERCASKRYDVIHANQGHCYQAAREHRRLRRSGVFVCRSHGLDDHMERVLAPWRTRLGVRSRRGLKKLAGGALDTLLHRHDRLAYREADGILVSSSADERYLRDVMHVPAARIGRVAQAPADAFVGTPAPSMDQSRIERILHVGGFAYWKGVHAVAEAANRLLAGTSRGRLTWVCRQEEQDHVRELLAPPVRERVDLVAWVPQSELRAIYDRHGIFLAPSLFEGFGKVFLEAMARGLCVVGTGAGGMPDVIRDGVDGFLVDYNDASGIVACIERCWVDPGLARSVSMAAAARAREYSWDRVGLEVVAFYERLLAARREKESDG